MKVRDSDVLAWVRGQRKVSQVLGTFWLLDFTMLLFFLGVRFETRGPFISLIFQCFFSGRDKPRILYQRILRHACTSLFLPTAKLGHVLKEELASSQLQRVSNFFVYMLNKLKLIFP
jgi:hypothetical protein